MCRSHVTQSTRLHLYSRDDGNSLLLLDTSSRNSASASHQVDQSSVAGVLFLISVGTQVSIFRIYFPGFGLQRLYQMAVL